MNAETHTTLEETAQELGANFVFLAQVEYLVDKKSAYHENDLPNPITQYGASEFEGEKRVCNAHVPALIFRAGWLLVGLFEIKNISVGARPSVSE